MYELGTCNYVDLISVRAQVQLHNDRRLGAEPGVRVRREQDLIHDAHIRTVTNVGGAGT